MRILLEDIVDESARDWLLWAIDNAVVDNNVWSLKPEHTFIDILYGLYQGNLHHALLSVLYRMYGRNQRVYRGFIQGYICAYVLEYGSMMTVEKCQLISSDLAEYFFDC